MNKTRSKKGFTLAELLIVVAIIAVLVAIAVPLFVGSLSKAQKARDDANIRAVRGAAVVFLLENQTKTDYWPETGAPDGWDVEATISGSGNIDALVIDVGKTKGYDPAGEVTEDGGKFIVKLHIYNTEVVATITPPPGP